MTIEEQNPYRGPFAFHENDEDLFFGRSSEVEELITLIKKHQLTTLYGASGTGKTSLIHAKLLPQLKREYFHPIYLRINFTNRDEDPLAYIQRRIVEELRIWDDQIPDFASGQTLIQYAAKNVIFKGLIKPVLFFDQFEELFTLGPKADPFKVHRFIYQLSELIELRLPDNLKTLDSINNITSFKVVFSLRQDWIGFLDDFNHIIPSINEARYRLKKFSPSQALEAILCPAKGVIERSTAEIIIRRIGTPALWKDESLVSNNSIDKDLINTEIDPFVLSLYCHELYAKSIQQGLSEISADFVLKHEDGELIRNYYEEKITLYPEIRLPIEEKLLNESGKRLIIPLKTFASNNIGLIEATQRVAGETGILRIIGTGEESEVEIVHDRLASRIFESKNERIAKQLHEEVLKKEKAVEKLKSSARQAKRTTFTIGIAASILILILSALAIRMYIQFRNDHTLIGLQAQLDQEKQKNIADQETIAELKADLYAITTKSEENIINTASSSEQDVRKVQEAYKKQQDSLNDSKQKIVELNNSINRKDEVIQALEFQYSIAKTAQESIEKQLASYEASNIEAITKNSLSFKKTDLSNLKIENTYHQNSSGYDFDEIKKQGFKFSFDLEEIAKNEKGKIEIRVTANVSKGGDNWMHNFETLQKLKTLQQPMITVVAPPRLKPGMAYYEVRYYIDRPDKSTTILLARKEFKISHGNVN